MVFPFLFLPGFARLRLVSRWLLPKNSNQKVRKCGGLPSQWAKGIGLGLLAILMCIPVTSFAQVELGYQNRGGYQEGIKGKPIGGEDLVLISGMVDYQEPVEGLPDWLRMKFYLEEFEKIDVRVREIEQKYFYWMDNVKPQKPWAKGFENSFEWPTELVLKSLNDRMNIYDLGVVVKVEPHHREDIDLQIAPPIFYSKVAPSKIAAYRFALKPGENAKLYISIDQGTETQTVYSTQVRRAIGGRPVHITWDAGDSETGFYRLVIEGSFLDTGHQVRQRIGFFHQPTHNP